MHDALYSGYFVAFRVRWFMVSLIGYIVALLYAIWYYMYGNEVSYATVFY